jgi:hypothetical protein
MTKLNTRQIPEMRATVQVRVLYLYRFPFRKWILWKYHNEFCFKLVWNLGLKTVVSVANLKKNNEQRILGPNEQEVTGEWRKHTIVLSQFVFL